MDEQQIVTFEDKVKEIYDLTAVIKFNESIVNKANAIIKELQAKVDILKADVLAEMQEKNQKETIVEGLYANVYVNSSTGYADEGAVINYLKEHNYNDFLKVTTTIKKKELNAELKKNADLKKDIDSFITTKTTPYVTVTDEENHTKMLEHINEAIDAKIKKSK